jgi:uncharacterized damage-inducible protein DinB
MSDFPELLRTHIDYSAWASQRLVDAASRLSPEELTRDFATADHSVLDTLVHLYAADRLWLARLQGGPHPGFVSPADRSLAVLQNDWPATYQRWKEWARAITPESADAVISYTDLRGNPWSQPLWKLILHVVNHDTHHRGQVSGFLRAMGHVPPPLDLVLYYRDQSVTPPDPR